MGQWPFLSCLLLGQRPLPAEALFGAVSFLHRFGYALNPHPHLHLALFIKEPDDALTLHPARLLDAANARIMMEVSADIARMPQRSGEMRTHLGGLIGLAVVALILASPITGRNLPGIRNQMRQERATTPPARR